MPTKREKLDPKDRDPGGAYFDDPESPIEWIPTGSKLLDCVLGGGYAACRVINIVGDKSTGKTLLAIEAAANFARIFKGGDIIYNEAESAFDPSYAKVLGFPFDRVQFTENDTIEDFFEHLQALSESRGEKDPPLFYILDSLDALSDRAEKGRDIDAGTYGAEKAKKLSQLFRRQIRELGRKGITLFIISQVRENIGVTFGRRFIRAGGKALDFYASQVLFLSHLPKAVTRQSNNVERTIGIRIKAKCDKNKVALPFRDCEFPILFGYGIDDLTANLSWLKEIGRLNEVGLTDKTMVTLLRESRSMSDQEYEELVGDTAEVVGNVWQEIETDFMPKRSKY